jgi:hypothetical protein
MATMGRLIGGFITVLVGVSILPTVANEAKGAVSNSSGGTDGVNVTGASKTVTDLIPLFYAIGVMSAGIAVAVGGLKDAGIM